MGLYDYNCSSCNETWDEYRKMSENKVPESLPCPKCGAIGTVLQTIAYTNAPISHVKENNDAYKKLRRSAFADKMQMIHDATPQSNMKSGSTIIEIK